MRNDPIRLSLIAAIDRNRLIGVDSERMPWHLPDDLRHFKRLTLGKPVIMGRRTFESIGRPLPGRLNIVVTRGGSIDPIEGQLQVASDLASARRLGEAWIRQQETPQAEPTDADRTPELMVIGGAQIYAQALPDAARLYLTEIDAEYSGNNHFPDFAQMEPGWAEIDRDSRRASNDTEPSYAFVTYDRKR